MEAQREFEFKDSDFKQIVTLVSKKTGIVLADHKKDMVYSRIARRLRALNIQKFSDYCEFLYTEQGEEEIGNFVNAITTNLTSFFREIHHFEFLENYLKELEEKNKIERKIRIWSAGCSAGPEPYSIAMVVANHFENKPGWDIKILATDIDTNMLNTGSDGEYSDKELEKIPAKYKKYLSHKAGKMQMGEKIRKYISFNHLNLLENWPIKNKFDVIFCRNVVIYFDKPTQKVLFAKYANVLKPKGIMIIGHSENLFKVSDDYELIGRTIYRKL